jgi:hypothetical protein
MQIPVDSIETWGGSSTWLWGMPFLTETAVPPSLLGNGWTGRSDNLE